MSNVGYNVGLSYSQRNNNWSIKEKVEVLSPSTKVFRQNVSQELTYLFSPYFLHFIGLSDVFFENLSKPLYPFDYHLIVGIGEVKT